MHKNSLRREIPKGGKAFGTIRPSIFDLGSVVETAT
jgi:hypothetical protein